MIRAVLLCLMFGLGLGGAQVAPETSASFVMNDLWALAEEAKQTYEGQAQTIDSPLWRQVINRAETLKRENPGNVELQLFLATSYGYVGWDSRAYENWLTYLEGGGSLGAASSQDVNAEQLFEAAATEIGFARYEANRLRDALPYYETVLSYLPENREALRWLGRIHLELGEPETAIPYWEALAELGSGDESVNYYLGLAREQVNVGPEASRAFQRGIGAYEAGDLETALDAFAEAARLNNSFVNAFVWAGRSALESGASERAARYWRRVAELDPQDERPAYFIAVAETQARWGQAATAAFYQGQAYYEEDDLGAAAEQFERAFDLEPRFKDAAVWAARSYQENGDLEAASRYWQEVLRLDPDDRRAASFLRVAELQSEQGAEAGQAFVQGVSAFERADLESAAAFFEQAVAENETYAEAWGWLGRVYFTQQNYSQAARAYGRASELAPADEGYSFFAVEAARLAGGED